MQLGWIAPSRAADEVEQAARDAGAQASRQAPVTSCSTRLPALPVLGWTAVTR